jgi:hypothetical protein
MNIIRILFYLGSQLGFLTATTLQKIDLTSIDKLALCNDGSPAQFYWKPE